MGLGDRIRRYFRKRSNPALRALEGFAQERKGVEGFVEPQTATQPTTLLLVDRDGDHRRAPVEDPAEAAAFCDRFGIPVYDAQVIGYPKRMRDFATRRTAASAEAIDAQFAELEKRLRDEGDPTGPDN